MYDVRLVPRWVVLCAVTLCFAAVADLPYGFYRLLRWIVCAVSIGLVVESYRRSQMTWVWIFGIVALVFNPFIRMTFEKDVWRILDVAAGISLLIGTSRKM